jgi:hypothetical protein
MTYTTNICLIVAILLTISLFFIPRYNKETCDNRITNALVDVGVLPESEREIYPQN